MDEVSETLLKKRNGLTSRDIWMLIPHQANDNLRIIDAVSKLLSLTPKHGLPRQGNNGS